MKKEKNLPKVITPWHTYKGEIFSFTHEDTLRVNDTVNLFTRNGEICEPYEYGLAVVIEVNHSNVYTARRV